MKINHDPSLSTAELDEELRRRIDEFQHQQSSWEVRRDAEQEYLEQTAKQLSDAWLALEDEQRALLCVNGASVLVSPVGVERRAQHVEVTAEPIATAVGQTSKPMPAPTVNSRVAIPRDLVPRDVAVRQFEKLRNQVQSTRR